jgi:hypothetical protein
MERDFPIEVSGVGRAPQHHQLIAHQDQVNNYAKEHLFGADFDPFLVRAASMSVMMLTGEAGNVYYIRHWLVRSSGIRPR